MPVYIPTELESIPYFKLDGIERSNKRLEGDDCLNIAVLNLMPNKVETERHLLKLMDLNEININVFFVRMGSHKSKNTSQTYLDENYYLFDDIKDNDIDGLIVTGAPVALKETEDITYWKELVCILDWATDMKVAAYFICWSAIATLEYYYNVPKVILEQKFSGLYEHKHLCSSRILKGIPNPVLFPISRYTGSEISSVHENPNLKVCLGSESVGGAIIEDPEKNWIFASSHIEYGTATLADEYFRDEERGIKPLIPCNYFTNNQPIRNPPNVWVINAQLLFENWFKIILSK